VKSLRFIHDDGIGQDQSAAVDVQFRESPTLQELQPGLVDQRKKGIIAEMVAVIDVADTYANIGRERKVIGQVQLDACHVDSLTPG
jgi:hypothetical protein